MASIFDMFASQLNEGHLDQIAKQLGTDKNQTRDAISMTLPALIEALNRKVEQAGGAEDLHKKLGEASQANRSGGSMLDQLNDILGQGSRPSSVPEPHTRSKSTVEDILPPTTPPATKSSSPPATQPAQPTQRQPAPTSLPDIFGELLGNKQGKLGDAVSRSSGIDKEQAGSLISMLGPILSEMLGSQTKDQQMSPGDLSEMLRKDREKIQQSPGGSMFSKMFDQDGDGDFDMNDMMKLGMDMLLKK